MMMMLLLLLRPARLPLALFLAELLVIITAASSPSTDVQSDSSSERKDATTQVMCGIRRQDECNAEERLMVELFDGYQPLLRPKNASNEDGDDITEVTLSLAVILLINVDERNQIMQTNVWPTMEWLDHQLRWTPSEWEGVQTLRVAPDKLWLPDVVLFNNADGTFEVSYYSHVVVEYTGALLWVPPAIYRSACTIDVEYFPFDEQICSLHFGSWTYRQSEVRVVLKRRFASLVDYSPSGVWDMLEAAGDEHSKLGIVSYHIRIRRRPLFFTFILIMPTMIMSFLSMLVFYLPAETGEKVTLSISILLSLVLFLLVLSKILPPTSASIPLIAKYLLVTFTTNMCAIAMTVCILHIYWRGGRATTRPMPKIVKTMFLKHLPLMLLMPFERAADSSRQETPRRKVEARTNIQHHPHCSRIRHQEEARRGEDGWSKILDAARRRAFLATDEARMALEALDYVTAHVRHEHFRRQVREEWRRVAQVVDRILLYVLFAATAGGSASILFSAPHVFERINQTAVLERLNSLNSAATLITSPNFD